VFALPVAGHAAGLVDGQRGGRQQQQEGGGCVKRWRWVPQPFKVATGQGGCCRHVGQGVEGLGVEQQDGGGDEVDRNRPQVLPRDETSPVSSEARLRGTRTTQPVSSITRIAPRTVCGSWLVRPVMLRTRKASTAPSHPTEAVTWAVRVSLRRLCRGRRRTTGIHQPAAEKARTRSGTAQTHCDRPGHRLPMADSTRRRDRAPLAIADAIPDLSGADQIDGEHQAADLAIGIGVSAAP
jgi:hypothetical protein